MTQLKSERRWYFSWLDLVAPWGVGLLIAGLCLWGMISGRPVDGGDPTIPRAILGLVGLVFLSTIPAWYFARSVVRRFDFKIEPMGLYVKLDRRKSITPSQAQLWVDDLMKHWTDTVYLSKTGPRKLTRKEVEGSLADKMLIYIDEDKLRLFNRWFSGFNTSEDAVVCVGKGEVLDIPRASSLTRHELSHFILDHNGEPWDEEKHHNIFRYTKLGA